MLYLLVCQNCPDMSHQPDAIASLQASLNELALDDLSLDQTDLQITVKAAPCLGICSAPYSITLQGEGRASLIFKDVDLDQDRGDIIATCKAWLAADQGWIEDARPCGKLRHHLHARIPALPSS